uniref:Uncharacterized protein n=1 Tax=Pseudonaja textilis TaxID=8673 RepID=A0A670ZKN1_PSETE
MHQIIQTAYSWFWWENIWMPANCTWADLEDHNGYIFPKPRQLFATIPYAFVMLVIRFFQCNDSRLIPLLTLLQAPGSGTEKERVAIR